MASNLSRVLRKGDRAFIPFITAGHPDIETTLEVVVDLASSGAAVVEIGIPFSDPVADGPTIQKSSYKALSHGYRVSDYLELVRQIRRRSEVGLIFMTYLNPVLQYGLKELDEDAAAAGLDGILISDLTPEEYFLVGSLKEGELEPARKAAFRKLDTVFLAAPTSSDERLKLIGKASTGFVYLIARTGVTGKQTELDESLSESVGRVRAVSDLPVAVGFGIRSRSDVEKVWQYADAAIVGSAIVKFMDENKEASDLSSRVAKYVRDRLIPVF